MRWASRTCCGSARARRWPGCSSATTSPSATATARPSRSWSSSTRCCRAGTPWWSGPTSSSAAPTSSSTTSWAGRSRNRRARRARSCSRRRCSRASTGSTRCRSPSATTSGSPRPPAEQFGKLMSLPDELMPRYFLLTTGWHPDRVEETVAALARRLAGAGRRPSGCSPAPSSTSTTATGRGTQAEAEFDRVFRRHDAPTEIPEHVLDLGEAHDGRIRVANVLAPGRPGRRPTRRAGARSSRVASASTARSSPTPTWRLTPDELDGATLQVGKRSWIRVRRAQ